MTRKLSLPCDCAGSCTVAVVTEFEQTDKDRGETFVEFYEHPCAQFTLRRRLRVAWQVARGRDPWTHGICLMDPTKVRQLADFLTESLPEGSD